MVVYVNFNSYISQIKRYQLELSAYNQLILLYQKYHNQLRKYIMLTFYEVAAFRAK
jgi:hypothetical protein